MQRVLSVVPCQRRAAIGHKRSVTVVRFGVALSRMASSASDLARGLLGRLFACAARAQARTRDVGQELAAMAAFRLGINPV